MWSVYNCKRDGYGFDQKYFNFVKIVYSPETNSTVSVLCFKRNFDFSDKKLATRVVSPPSYAAPSSFAPVSRSPSKSPSRSPSPEHSTIEFITSFGPDDDEKPREWF